MSFKKESLLFITVNFQYMQMLHGKPKAQMKTTFTILTAHTIRYISFIFLILPAGFHVCIAD